MYPVFFSAGQSSYAAQSSFRYITWAPCGLLISNGRDFFLTGIDKQDGRTVLMRWVLAGNHTAALAVWTNIERVGTLLRQGARVNAKDSRVCHCMLIIAVIPHLHLRIFLAQLAAAYCKIHMCKIHICKIHICKIPGAECAGCYLPKVPKGKPIWRSW